jgi:hypothetical protein
MNTLPPTSIESSAPATADATIRIALACNFPIRYAVYGLNLTSVAMFRFVIQGLEFAMERERLISEKLIWSGDFCNGWAGLRTNQRTEALEIIHAWRQKNEILRMLSSVGWYCEAEEDWRITVHSILPMQFADCLVPEAVEDRLAVMEKANELMQRSVAELEKTFPPLQ